MVIYKSNGGHQIIRGITFVTIHTYFVSAVIRQKSSTKFPSFATLPFRKVLEADKEFGALDEFKSKIF